MIDLVLIRATRGDEAYGLQGALCRGEFFETILRLVHSKNMHEPEIAPLLEDFLQSYIQPIVNASTLIKERRTMRGSKKLNQILFENAKGLRMFFKEYKEINKGFTQVSAEEMFKPLNPNDTKDSYNPIVK